MNPQDAREDFVPVPKEVFEGFLATRPSAAEWAVLMVVLHECHSLQSAGVRWTLTDLCAKTHHTRREVQKALWRLQGLRPSAEGREPEPDPDACALLVRRRTSGEELRRHGPGFLYAPIHAGNRE